MHYFGEAEFEVRREQYKDLLREADRERLIRLVRSHHRANVWELYLKVADWIGTKMVKWGSKLQTQPQTTVARCSEYC
jgi:hypothetical protein